MVSIFGPWTGWIPPFGSAYGPWASLKAPPTRTMYDPWILVLGMTETERARNRAAKPKPASA